MGRDYSKNFRPKARETLTNSIFVIPANAGIQEFKELRLGKKSKSD